MDNKMNAVEVLLVEDDPADAELTTEALKTAKMVVSLSVVDDGVKAMQYLRAQGPYAGAPRPDLILLDLNLPRMNGSEVLKAIKSDAGLRNIPVVVLTTSYTITDMVKCREIGADYYITKPVGFEAFVNVVRSIEDFWFTVVKMPPKG